MFVLKTARAGEAYHVLYPTTRLIHVDPILGDTFELSVHVRESEMKQVGVDQYVFRFRLHNAYTKDKTFEVITYTEHQRRHRLASERGKPLTDEFFFAEEHPVLWEHCTAIKEHFVKLMDSKMFELPRTT